MQLKKFKLLLVFVILFSGVLGGCSKNQNKALHLAVDKEFDASFTDINVNSGNSALLYKNTMEGLVRQTLDGRIIPGIAENWVADHSNTIYTFMLREAMWSDGTSITAQDFEDTWKKRMLDWMYYLKADLHILKNGIQIDYHEGDIATLGVKAISEKELQIELSMPMTEAELLEVLSQTSFYPAHHSGDGTIINGPYQLERLTPTTEAVLVKNEHYWNTNEVSFEEIFVHVVKEQITHETMFTAGDLDIISTLKNDAPIKLQNEVIYLPLFTNNDEVQHANLRQALMYSVDVNQFQQIIDGSNAQAVVSQKDETKARENIEIAKKETNKDKFTLIYSIYLEDYVLNKIYENLQYQVQSVLPEVEIIIQKVPIARPVIASNNTKNPITFFEQFYSKNLLVNRIMYKNYEYDQLIEQYYQTGSQAERQHILENLLEKLEQDNYLMRGYTKINHYIYSSKIKNNQTLTYISL